MTARFRKQADQAGADRLKTLIASELDQATPPAVRAAAREAMRPFGNAVQAVLFYGSCLRTGDIRDKVLDFYVLVDSYRRAHGPGLMAFLNRILPPNVYYSETEYEGTTVRAKTAVISMDSFYRRAGPGPLNISIWARFAQPAALVFVAPGMARSHVVRSLARCVRTMLGETMALSCGRDAEDLWKNAFRLTYGAELRSESGTRGDEVYRHYAARFRRITGPALEKVISRPVAAARIKWIFRRINGKTVSLLRLVKAAFTFRGGVDYLAWKIERHSGVKVQVRDWHRRHPVIGGIVLAIRLRMKGAFR